MARVLLVDDEPNILYVLEAALTELGHEVAAACNGREALAVLDSAPAAPDVVLLDLLMPKLGGGEVLAAMRTDPRFARVPVALVTGSVTTSDRLPAPWMYQALVNKPFDLWALADLVAQLAEGTLVTAASAAALGQGWQTGSRS